MHRPLKLVGYLVVAVMAVAVMYVAYISIQHWSGIGV